jgi:endonuclease/exonuclease/phosphatase family metal-dependent hydrolase
MARKKKKSAKLSKPMLVLIIVIIIIGIVYYLWVNNDEFNALVEDTTGIQTTTQTVQQTTPPPTTAGSGVPENSASGTIRVYSFNIQIFGASKMRKTAVVQVLTDIISKVDVVCIQEVRSTDEEPVIQFMSLLPKKYQYVLGPREGRTASKEQYWVIYDSEKLEVVGGEDGVATYPDDGDRFQRSPMGVYFQTNDQFDFIVVDNHIQPSDAAKEIAVLPEVITYFQKKWRETDVLVMGDFNADGSYYNEKNLINIFPEPDYHIIITNEWDTTVAGDGDSTTYDRFIITKSAMEDFTGNFGVVYYDKIYDFASLGIEPKAVSDHFPIWAEFYTDRDTD